MASVEIPNTVTTIGGDAFRSTGLTSITLPTSLTQIDGYCFMSCTGLTSITIPNAITSIGTKSFAACSAINSITFTSTTTVPTIGTNTFLGVQSIGTVYGQSGLDFSTVMAALPNGWTLVQ